MRVLLAAAGSFMIVTMQAQATQIPRMQITPVSDSTRTEIVSMLDGYYDALSDRDWSRFQTYFWPRATITALWQPPGEDSMTVQVQTVAEFVMAAPEGPGSREVFEERMRSAHVNAHGSIAQVFTRYWARFGDPGDMTEWEGVDAFMLLKHEGQWGIVALAFSPDRS